MGNVGHFPRPCLRQIIPNRRRNMAHGSMRCLCARGVPLTVDSIEGEGAAQESSVLVWAGDRPEGMGNDDGNKLLSCATCLKIQN